VARIVSTTQALVIGSSTGATFRIAPRLNRHQAVLEVMDAAGAITQVRLSPEDMRRLAAALMKLSVAVEAADASDETTQP
jgi:hypothetical protein